MKIVILLITLISLTGCSKEPIPEKLKNTDGSNPKIGGPSESQIYHQLKINSYELTPENSRVFATRILKKIIDDEKVILQAFELKEPQKLEQYFYDVQSFMFPYSDEPTKSYWPDSNLLDPYIKCDTALRDLQIYSNALFLQLRSDNPTSRKIVRQEKEDFENSKIECVERANMTYDEAMKVYEEE